MTKTNRPVDRTSLDVVEFCHTVVKPKWELTFPKYVFWTYAISLCLRIKLLF